MLKRTYLRLVEMQEEQARQHLEEVRSIHQASLFPEPDTVAQYLRRK